MKNSYKYFLHGSLRAKKGERENLADILLQASGLMSKAEGCILYVVGLSDSDSHEVYVTEIWASKKDHDRSLQSDTVKQLIQKAIPLVDGEPSKGQELEIIGGHGI